MTQISWIIFVMQLISTFMLLGIVWLVQLINYPLFKLIPESLFRDYHALHINRSQWLIAPLMLVEMLTGAYLLIWPLLDANYYLYVCNFVLILLVWLETFFLQIPIHKTLQKQHSQTKIDRLINMGWVRTITWSLHGIVLILILIPKWQF